MFQFQSQPPSLTTTTSKLLTRFPFRQPRGRDHNVSSSLRSLFANDECSEHSFSNDSVIQNVTQCSDTDQQDRNVNRWKERYQDLVKFKEKYGHCLVPLHWSPNPPLGHWVKRQRSQYTFKITGRRSSLTEEREGALRNLGFVWDSHAALWEERLNELRAFRGDHGHCQVPSRYVENPKLSVLP